MPYYKVMLEGDGIDIPSEENGPSIIGFFTTRLVRASTPKDAEEKAMTMILSEWKSGTYALANRGLLPNLVTSSIEQASLFETFKSKYSGYSFYSQAEAEELEDQ